MTQYRKAGMRTFYMVKEDGSVIKVINKKWLSQVIVCNNELLECEATDQTEVITEAEFTTEYNIAKERLLNQSI